MISEVKEFIPRVKAEEGQQEEEPVSFVVLVVLKILWALLINITSFFLQYMNKGHFTL